MSIRENIKKARGSLVFLVGLTIAFGTVFALEQWQFVEYRGPISHRMPVVGDQFTRRARRELTAEERRFAEIAWKYFESNTHPRTGLVNSVDQYPASTMWDTASYLLGLIAAERLGIVGRDEFDQRMKRVFNTLANLPLFDNRLPNKSYRTTDGVMVTYDNALTERGIGWSAIDIGRLLVPFHVLAWHYPELTDSVRRVLRNWDFEAIVVDAQMVGAAVDADGNTLYLQEGRLGYEEYAAKALALTGMDLSLALDYEAYLKFVEINNVSVGTDLRSPDEFDALNLVVSEPYVLDGMEYGWDRYSRSLAFAVYEAQEARYHDTGILTAVSEDNLDRPPYFVYNTIYAAGRPWHAITKEGKDASAFRSVSTKTAIGLHVLYDTPYTAKLIELIRANYHPEKGWYSGIYEANGETNTAITANTNGIVLEALHYLKYGPMLRLKPLTTASSSH